jgi:peptide/nickel transport system substrate-binding protein
MFRTRGKSSVRPLAAVLALSAAVFGCAKPQPVDPRAISVSLSSDIRSTNPGVNRDGTTDTVMMHLVEGLVAYRENGEPGLLLAQSLKVSPDGRTYAFRLRPDVRFHNGAPLTSREAMWTWRRYLDPKTGWVCLSDFDGSRGPKIISVTAPDPQSVVFQLDRPQPMLLSQMAAVQCGESAILHPASVNVDGSWRALVATGPYKLGAWKKGEFIELDAFPGYHPLAGPRDGLTGGKVALAPKIRFLVIRDGVSRLSALAKGQIDLMVELSVGEMGRLQRQQGVALETAPMNAVNAILIQSADPVLRDVRVRRALALSIDRNAIAELASGGVGASNPSMVPVASRYHSKVHDLGYQRNLAEARALLAQTGYHGQPIRLATNRRFADMFDQALLVQAMSKEAGFNIQLDVLEWATQLDRYQAGKYQLMSFAYSARADPYLTYDSMMGPAGGGKRKVWHASDALAVAEQAAATGDVAARQALFDDLHRKMLRDVPLIVLFNPADVNARRTRLQGFHSWALGRARLWGVRRLQQG